ncbi:serine/threonine-protein kinase [Streptomyces sp. 549]|uniref:serine/threonine-protein kinase n=1 Tax=Streptomyces sp. 549 TaxID=3049076 RepID=UPI0024C43726|nr:serine/threonine-protein kinase [Streptomyces sp. 549]MDK1476696.1 serine/threonine-protein kinase [Streptomyces sp. 549]
MQRLEPADPRQIGGFRIVGRLGAGGMGRVYLGLSRGGRAVAVKVVRPELAEDREFRQRFRREVVAARRVNGAFTAGVVDADPEAAPPWLATVYVPGVSLDEAVAAHGPWPQPSVLALAAGLAEALEAVHAADLVHRDLKPSNVLLASDGPRVIDFGISVAGEASALTRTGMVVGTPGFMSPEQLTGRPVGPASDVFSLGAVLAFTASGTGPFGSGSAQALMFRVVHEQPELDALSGRLAQLVARCLDKDPARRPQVEELLASVAGAAGSEGGTVAFSGARWLPPTVAATVRARTDETTATHGPAADPAPGPGPAPRPDPSSGPVPDPAPGQGTPPGTPAPPWPQPQPQPQGQWGRGGPTWQPGPAGHPGHPGPPSGAGHPGRRTGTAVVTVWSVIAAVLVAGLVVWSGYALSGAGSGSGGTHGSGTEGSTPGGGELDGRPATDGPDPGGTGGDSAEPRPSSGTSVLAVAGTWQGTYECLQGTTGLQLTVGPGTDGQVHAVFSFFPVPSNPGVASGSFVMVGTWEDGVLRLFGDRWIQQPAGYEMGDLAARYDPAAPRRLQGRAIGPGCTTFTTTRSG